MEKKLRNASEILFKICASMGTAAASCCLWRARSDSNSRPTDSKPRTLRNSITYQRCHLLRSITLDYYTAKGYTDSGSPVRATAGNAVMHRVGTNLGTVTWREKIRLAGEAQQKQWAELAELVKPFAERQVAPWSWLDEGCPAELEASTTAAPVENPRRRRSIRSPKSGRRC
jgi:hypothetical protein